MLQFITQKVKRLFTPAQFAGSANYWESRYKQGGSSGAGSTGRLADFKAHFINDFISDHQINTAIEWGSGDGQQAARIIVPAYIGYDVSPTAVSSCKAMFEDDTHRQFFHTSAWKAGKTAELTLSLDVIYHLVEDAVYHKYMEQLFDSSSRFVIVYSCDFDAAPTANHVRPRKFTEWVTTHRPQWVLKQLQANPYPMTKMDDPETSWSDFFVFEKRRTS